MEAIPQANAIRPCFSSRAHRDQFESLVRLVTGSLWGSGLNHAWGVAKDVAGLSHDPSAIMRCARAEHASVTEDRKRSAVQDCHSELPTLDLQVR
ncbi:hypothetical protein G6L37_07510 [Agrobacterium rubi]|nr:hypothetical protein [Agrobacterium rubi]NTF25215.1 hypothetical protein [Agrobacterium rubi]